MLLAFTLTNKCSEEKGRKALMTTSGIVMRLHAITNMHMYTAYKNKRYYVDLLYYWH